MRHPTPVPALPLPPDDPLEFARPQNFATLAVRDGIGVPFDSTGPSDFARATAGTRARLLGVPQSFELP